MHSHIAASIFRHMNKRNFLVEEPRSRTGTMEDTVSMLSTTHPPRLASTCRKTKYRFLRSTIAIVLCYIVLWLPYQVFSMWSTVCVLRPENSCGSGPFPTSLEFLVDITIINSCLSPFLYKFRRETSHNRSSSLGTGRDTREKLRFWNSKSEEREEILPMRRPHTAHICDKHGANFSNDTAATFSGTECTIIAVSIYWDQRNE